MNERPRIISLSLNIDGTIFTMHVFDDERGHKVRREWLLYMIESVEPTMNPATLFQARVP